MISLSNQVQDILVEMTRYPAELFTLDADFEDDLGIDSVKLAEIYAVLQQRFSLDKQVALEANRIRNLADLLEFLDTQSSHPKETLPERPTVAKVITRLAGNMDQPNHLVTNTWIQGKETALATNPPKPDKPSVGQISKQELLETLAEVTRYPLELFSLDADLEDDLGIDSVKQAEIFAVVAERFQLGTLTNQDFSNIQTVGDVLTSVQRLPGQPPIKNQSSPKTHDSDKESHTLLFSKQAVNKPLLGKIALVTGSGHGIGATIAEKLAALGAQVIVNSFHSRQRGEATVERIRQQGGKALHLWGSVAKQDHLEHLFSQIEAQFGGLDFFIHNASNGLIAPLQEIQPNHWEKAFRTNVVGLHQGALMAARLMKPRGGGNIIALSSPGAQRTIEHFGCMGPVKAAVESLVRYLAIDLKPQGIAVNAISAGPVQGELLQKYPDADRLIPQWEQLSLGSELITAEEVTHAVLYLLSPLASKISGSVHLLDGTIALSL